MFRAMDRRLLVLSLASCLLAAGILVACGDDGGQPGATPTPTAALTASPTAQLTTTPSPTPTPGAAATGRIAFISDRDGNDEVYVMNADDSGQTRLTNNPDFDGQPAWSPVP